ncbi:MAG: transposase [Planctomycetaceae bacterium]
MHRGLSSATKRSARGSDCATSRRRRGSARTFPTELSDLDRFANRRQLAAYPGLAPSSFESGERDDIFERERPQPA